LYTIGRTERGGKSGVDIIDRRRASRRPARRSRRQLAPRRQLSTRHSRQTTAVSARPNQYDRGRIDRSRIRPEIRYIII
jgi:hypothetical protein